VRGTIIYKMTGSGNDFVVLDGRYTDPKQWPAAQVAAICDRRSGVGADGLVILSPEAPGTVRMRYWNSDGSPAAMCGNAALCSARLAVYLELAPPGELCLHTDVGMVRARSDGSGTAPEINLPDFPLPADVPGLASRPEERWLMFASVGVPHLVARVEDVERVDLSARGRSLRQDPSFQPGGANVNFVSSPAAHDDQWLIRTYERGVEGETLACGTGTVAAAVALATRGEASLPVRFRSRGGPELVVRAELNAAVASDVWLQGEGRLLFRAVWEDI
jgi:diaminopimelate epimerase